jgi:hypothetical protein
MSKWLFTFIKDKKQDYVIIIIDHKTCRAEQAVASVESRRGSPGTLVHHRQTKHIDDLDAKGHTKKTTFWWFFDSARIRQAIYQFFVRRKGTKRSIPIATTAIPISTPACCQGPKKGILGFACTVIPKMSAIPVKTEIT